MKKFKAVVLLSGGVDSTTCLAVAVEKFGAENVLALTITYGQKHNREIESAKKVANHYGVEIVQQDLSEIFRFSNSSLLKNSSEKIRHQSYAEQISEIGHKTVDTYVPFRNGVFLSFATAIAMSLGADFIYYGAHADDAAGSAYPDCSPKFKKAMHDAIFEGSGKVCDLITPFILKNKSDVVAEGLRLKVPYELTWSCYEGGDKPCGTCATCIDRKKAFELNGVKDPCTP